MTLRVYGVLLWLGVSRPLPRWGHLALWVCLPATVARAF